MTEAMPNRTSASSSLTSHVHGLLDSPLVGLAPWIVYAMIEGQGRLELSAGVANIALVVIALGSILVRNPFTLSYAREGTPKEYWDSPEFLKVNYLISWVWVAAFVVEAVSGFVGDGILHNPNNLWTGWIIQTFALIVAAQFTIWYPSRLDALRDGRAESAPTVKDFAATVAPWVTTVGIIALSVGGTPQAVSITLIVLGIVLTRSLTANDDSAPVESGASIGAAAG